MWRPPHPADPEQPMSLTAPVPDDQRHRLDFQSAVGSEFVPPAERDAVLAMVVKSLLDCYSAVEALSRPQADLLCDVVGDLLCRAESSCGGTAI